MAKNTSTKSSTKPAKPYPDFPLFPHASKQWAKKINGKLHYFGTWNDPQAALDRYLNERDDLYAGRTPARGDGLTVEELINEFLTSKQRLVDSGELTARTLTSYDCRKHTVLEVFGHNRCIETLRPTDFEELRAKFAESHGPKTLTGDVVVVRMMFRYAYEAGLLERPVRLGPNFKTPSRRTMRQHRNSRGKKLFAAEQIHAVLKECSQQLKAMVYLGINCGFGHHDCAMLPLSALNDGWVEFPRPKTGIQRRCPLWPETVAALETVLAKRPDHESNHVFITKYMNTWEPKSADDSPITKETVKVLKKLGLHGGGLSFYALRHTFQTIGEKSRDKDAVRAIMGHAELSNDMSAVYNEEPVEDYRLRAVVDFVRDWLQKSIT